jgi:predicted dehydrogenase
LGKFVAAVVGTGFMGMAHVEGLRRAGIAVGGILGSSEEKSRDAASRWDIPRAYSDFAELLADAAVESVHLALPNRHHHGLAREALLAGKHVVCEKPLAMTSAQSAELVRLARARPGQATAVCYNVRFYPLVLEARERIRRGDLGEVLHVTGSYTQDWLLYPTDYNWRVLAEEGGELRAVADIGTHWLDLARILTGLEIEAVFADLRTFHPTRLRPRGEVETFGYGAGDREARQPIEIRTEDYGAVLLHFRGGARGAFHVSQVMAGRKNRLYLEVAGTRASLVWNSERPDRLWIGRRDAANETLPRDPSLLGPLAAAYAGYPGGHNEGYADTFKQLFRAFYAWASHPGDGERPPFATFEDGHAELLLCEAILSSSREGRWAGLEEVNA